MACAYRYVDKQGTRIFVHYDDESKHWISLVSEHVLLEVNRVLPIAVYAIALTAMSGIPVLVPLFGPNSRAKENMVANSEAAQCWENCQANMLFGILTCDLAQPG